MVTDATIENLFDENFLIRVLDRFQKVVCVRIDSVDNGVECFDALNALLNELREFHGELKTYFKYGGLYLFLFLLINIKMCNYYYLVTFRKRNFELLPIKYLNYF